MAHTVIGVATKEFHFTLRHIYMATRLETVCICKHQQQIVKLIKQKLILNAGGGNMDEQHEKQKMVVQGIIVEDVKKSSTPRPRLQKTSSARLNCLCSPTTHDGSFRCRYHRNPGLSRSSASIGSNLSALGA